MAFHSFQSILHTKAYSCLPFWGLQAAEKPYVVTGKALGLEHERAL